MGFPLWTVRSSSTTHETFCERHPSIELKRADASLFIDSYEYGDIH